jgi:hypothetical protein
MTKIKFLRYACLQNPHLHSVNSGFSVCASLELYILFIPKHKNPPFPLADKTPPLCRGEVVEDRRGARKKR